MRKKKRGNGADFRLRGRGLLISSLDLSLFFCFVRGLLLKGSHGVLVSFFSCELAEDI